MMLQRRTSARLPVVAVRIAVVVVAASACGIADSSGGDTPDGPTPPATAGGAAPPASGADGGAGAATIDGSVAGSAFTSAGAAYVITGADDPANVVVYVFSKSVACADIGRAGWDGPTALGRDPALQFLEIKFKSADVRTFTIVTGPNFGTGEALSNHTSASRSPNAELGASGGSAAITSYAKGARATGTFEVHFGASDALKGTFDAPYCAGGTEP